MIIMNILLKNLKVITFKECFSPTLNDPRLSCFSSCVCVWMWMLSHIRLSVAPWTVAWQVPLSKEFSRQEYWSGLPFPAPGDLPDLQIKPGSLASPAWQTDSLPLAPFEKPH